MTVTPLAPVVIPVGGPLRRIHLKLEGRGEGGSIKGRTARALVRSLEVSGQLRPDSVIVESTSGNLGVGLAEVARIKGYRFLAVVDPGVPTRALGRMRELGAEVHAVREADPNGGFLHARLEHVRQLCDSSDRFVWTDQYANPANPAVHELETGPEMWEQTRGRIDALFVAVSTGGTLAGLGAFFRRVEPRVRIVGVDVAGSVVLGGTPAPRLLNGIGSAQGSMFLRPELFDDAVIVDGMEAIVACRALAAESRLRVGGSSGAVIAAACQYLEAESDLLHPVCICPDGGENYEDTIFDDAWVRARELLATRGPPGVEVSA
ncbi:MAG: pyridoxal-phosphate dependent enzyme [Actinomycetota bacterium]|nr:pyridoxal-phosphate dependent enzyme [Actinomycetota bacterium]